MESPPRWLRWPSVRASRGTGEEGRSDRVGEAAADGRTPTTRAQVAAAGRRILLPAWLGCGLGALGRISDRWARLEVRPAYARPGSGTITRSGPGARTS